MPPISRGRIQAAMFTSAIGKNSEWVLALRLMFLEIRGGSGQGLRVLSQANENSHQARGGSWE